MKQELKLGIFIEGFDEKDLQVLCGIEVEDSGYDLLYEGKTSEIPDELASQCCKYQNSYEGEPFYKEYGDITWATYPYVTAKESIQSACDKKYCIIYKTKMK